MSVTTSHRRKSSRGRASQAARSEAEPRNEDAARSQATGSRSTARPRAELSHEPDDELALNHKLDWRQLRRLGRAMWPYRRMYLAALVCALLMAGCELVAPRLAQKIVDVGIPSGRFAPLLALGGMWLGIVLANLLLEVLQIGFSQRAGEGVVRDLRRAMFVQLQRLSMSFFDRHKLGQIITRPTSDLDAVRDTVVGGLNTIVANSLLSFGAGCLILLTDPVLFACVAWLIPILVCVNAHFRRVLGVQHQLVRAGFTRLTANLAENITGIRVVEAFNRQDTNLDRFNDLQDENTRNNNYAAHLNGLYGPLLEGIRLLGQVILVGYGAGQVLSGRLTPGQVVAAFFYWDLFMRPTITLGTFYNTLMMTLASSEKIFALLEIEPEVREDATAHELPPFADRLELDHVTFGYQPDRPVLHDICLTIPAGRTIALVGATGSGKTTILSLLTRMHDCQSGHVRLDGVDIRAATFASLRRQMGVVLQTNFLFSGSILDNIRYARPEADDAEVYAAAKALGVHELFLSQGAGYQTEVGERGTSVSLGLRQLICFTRVLLADPPIFLLDEATSSVDTATEEVVRRALKRLSHSRTTVIVAHRLSTITDADQIVVIDRGRIVETGTNAELLFQRGLYSRLYRQFLAAAG